MQTKWEKHTKAKEGKEKLVPKEKRLEEVISIIAITAWGVYDRHHILASVSNFGDICIPQSIETIEVTVPTDKVTELELQYILSLLEKEGVAIESYNARKDGSFGVTISLEETPREAFSKAIQLQIHEKDL